MWTICQAAQVLPQKATCSSLTALFQLTLTPIVSFAPTKWINKQTNLKYILYLWHYQSMGKTCAKVWLALVDTQCEEECAPTALLKSSFGPLMDESWEIFWYCSMVKAWKCARILVLRARVAGLSPPSPMMRAISPSKGYKPLVNLTIVFYNVSAQFERA